jgi:phosphotransferase system  glucose/maltose/N-acetylglucosamine-specific IIC component
MYYSKNGGCLFVFVILMLIVLIFGFFTRLLFTPVGITLALVFGVYYFINNKSKLNAKNDDSDVEMKNAESFTESELDDEEFSRDAEDVDFKKID